MCYKIVRLFLLQHHWLMHNMCDAKFDHAMSCLEFGLDVPHIYCLPVLFVPLVPA